MFSITCTGNGTSTLRITLTAGGSGAFAQRRMSNGSNTLNYNLYTTAARTTIWGDGTSGTSFLNPANSNGLTQPGVTTMVVYGTVPAQALPATGTYQDSITATLTCTNGGSCTNTSTQTLVVPVTATVGATCTVSNSNLDFGNYAGGTTSPVTSQAMITAHCAAGEAYAIGLSEGLYPGATTTTRRMTITNGGGDTTSALRYGLYTDPAGTLNWGNNFTGAPQDVVHGTGSGMDQEIPVYGKIDAGQNVRTGLYEDTILVTLSY
jgi:spore coat protein U-like protein